jgi:arsenite-transporting ATPase
MRIILFTGKGGVGKTSVAAATALRAAELGYKTIILSTDAAHSLSDSFDLPLGNEPRLIAPNLWGQETDISQTLKAKWGTIQNWVAALLAWRGVEEVIAEEMAILPGMEEMANLLYIVQHHDSGEYDVIIVDCAPTGETLRLLSFPEMLRWWMEKLFPIERTVASMLRPLIKPVFNIPLPSDEVFEEAQRLFQELQRMHALLTSPEKASVRLVVNPEKMVIKEAQRSYTYLSLYGYFTDMVICNRLLPAEAGNGYLHFWKEAQQKQHKLIEECFAPLPILDIPLLEQEVVGIPMLRTMAEALYHQDDPTRIFFPGQAQSIHKEDNTYVLTIALPFLSKEQLSIMVSEGELVIQAGSFRRNLLLPRVLAGLSVKEAKLEQGKLKIRFESKSRPEPTGKQRSKGR